ncbi:MAG: hypothetical protein H6814_07420 [Phycisphaeraceae bacterium]|nr:hypothetical protein [Phycisphaeraceae bacterium]
MRALRAALGLVVALAVVACGEAPARVGAGSSLSAPAAVCRCELRSWVVAGRGRHLYLSIEAPAGHDELNQVVEFTTESYRADYAERRDATGALLAPRVARMTPGVRLRPAFGDADDRLEAEWTITVEQARALERDRVWDTPYVLIGTNSNSAMAAALRDAGLEVPVHVRAGGGALGEFPGIDLALGPLVGADGGGSGAAKAR